jgi:hypothetical protein
VPNLAPATPATEVTVRTGLVEVDNHALIATWPAEALARARAAAPPDAADWPRLSIRLEAPGVDGRRIPALQHAFETARRAERAGSGAGSGARVYNLRVASDVPFATVERVLYSASLAGYGAPRLLLRAGGAERMMPWPRAEAPGASAPTAAEIEAALATLRAPSAGAGPPPDEPPQPSVPPGTSASSGSAAGSDTPVGADPSARSGSADTANAADTADTADTEDTADTADTADTEDPADTEPSEDTAEPAPRRARLELGEERVRAYLGDALQAPGCARDADDAAFTFTGDARIEALARCLRHLRERGDGGALTLEVSRALPFGRLAPVLQHAARELDGVRLVAR